MSAQSYVIKLALASEATLLFHSNSWSKQQVQRWHEITKAVLGQPSEATTKVLCDMHRAAQKELIVCSRECLTEANEINLDSQRLIADGKRWMEAEGRSQ